MDDLHSKGNSIILVTHEDFIAEHAHRVIRLHDGMIASDNPTEKGLKFAAVNGTTSAVNLQN
jgi:ABC-type lipoprotein export system ATPase subunit